MSTPSESAKSSPEQPSPLRIEMIPMSQIDPGKNPHRFDRESEDDIDLAADIKANGLLQPIIVRPVGDRFEVIAGNRRYAALQSLLAKEALCHIRQTSESEAEQLTFAENYFRKDLSPLELAVAIAKAYQSGRLSIKQLALVFKRSEDWIRRQVAITNWPDDVLRLIHLNAVSIAAAANLALVEDEAYREFLCRNAADNGATARTTAAWLQAWRAMQPPEAAIQSKPVPIGPASIPLIPQAPCLTCGNTYRVDALSHVPVCQNCLQALREAQRSQAAETA